MRALIIIGGIAGIFSVAVLVFLGSMGMFGKLAVAEKEMGPYTHVYESFKGPYQETGKIFDKVYKEVRAMGINSTVGLGVYYDDPSDVAKDELRSDCGLVLPEDAMDKLDQLKEKFQVNLLEKKPSIVTVFPVKNTMSYMFGPMKAYPALGKYADKNNLKIIKTYEVYDEPNKQIVFVANVETL